VIGRGTDIAAWTTLIKKGPKRVPSFICPSSIEQTRIANGQCHLYHHENDS